MTLLDTAVVRLTGDISDLKTALDLARGEMKKAGQEFEGMAGMAAVPLAALTGYAVLAARAYAQQEDAIARVNAVLSATGGVAGTTTGEIRAMAEEMQRLTRFDSDATTSAAGLLLTFRNVRNEMGAGNKIFDRAIHDAADLASIMGTELTTATMQLGRALEDPATGMMLLRRAGVQFSQAEREVIKIMMDHNQVLEAQQLILGKVEGKTKDAAAAMAATPLGHLSQMWNEITDASKRAGGVIVGALVPIADAIKNVAIWFKSLPPWAIKAAVAFLAVVAAVLALTVVIGALAPVIIGIGALFTLGFGVPIAIAVVAIGALIAAGFLLVENWEWVKLKLYEGWAFIKTTFTEGVIYLYRQIEGLGKKLQKIPDYVLAGIPGFGVILLAMKALTQEAGKAADDATQDLSDWVIESERTLARLRSEYGAAKGLKPPEVKAPGAGEGREPAWIAPTLKGFEKLVSELSKAKDMEKVLGGAFDAAGARASAYQALIQTLEEAHVGLNQSLTNSKELQDYFAKHPDVAKVYQELLKGVKELDPAFNASNATLARVIARMQQWTEAGQRITFTRGIEGAAKQQQVLGDAFAYAADLAGKYQGRIQELLGQGKTLDSVVGKNGETLRDYIETWQALQRISTLDTMVRALTGATVKQQLLGDTFNRTAAQADAYDEAVTQLIGLNVGLGDTVEGTDRVSREAIDQIIARLKALDPTLDTTGLRLQGLADRAKTLRAVSLGEQLQIDLGNIQKRAALLGPTFDWAAARVQAFSTEIDAAISRGEPLDQIWAQFGQGYRDARIDQITQDFVLAMQDIQTEVLLQGPSFDNWGQAIQAVQERIRKLVKEGVPLREAMEQYGKALRGMELARIWKDYDNAVEMARFTGEGMEGEVQALEQVMRALAEQIVKTGDANGSLRAQLKQTKEEIAKLKFEMAIGAFFRDEIDQAIDALFDMNQSFGEFITQMLRDLAKLVLKLAIFQLILDLFPGAAKFLGIAGAQHGGWIQPGELALVGEAGPEIVAAGSGGLRVMPLSEARHTAPAASAGGGGEPRYTTPVVVHVHAADAQSVETFFRRNEDLVAQTMYRATQRSALLRRRLGGG